MIQDTYNGEVVFILNDPPNFRQQFSTTFEGILDAQESLTKREARRPYSSTLRTSLTAVTTVSSEALRLLQGTLRGLKAQPVLIPFWPVVAFWSERASMKISGGLLVAFKSDWSQYEIYKSTDTEPVWPLAGDLIAPLLYGFLNNESKLKPIGVDAGGMSIDFTEASISDYALTFVSSGLTAGPSITGYGVAPKLLPFLQDYRGSQESIVVNVGREPFQLGRSQASTFYPHDPYRTQSAQYTLRGASDIATFLEWFRSVGGQGASFWGVGSLAIGYLANDALAAATSLTWTDSNVLPGDYIATLVGGVVKFAQISTVVGSVITLHAAFGVALSAGQPFFPLSLARLDKPKLTVTWLSPVLVKSNFSWSEVRPETNLPGNETLATTIGALGLRVVLFQFIRDYGNGTVDNFYLTSFESDLVYGGHTYLSSVDFKLGDVSTSLNLEDDSCQIESCLTKQDGTLNTDNPMVLDVMLATEAPLSVKVSFASYDGVTVTGVSTIFTGECSTIARKGNSLTASCKLGSSLFETMLPILVRGTMCSHLRGSPGDGTHLISQGCTGPDAIMLKSNWKCTGLVANPRSAAFPYALVLSSLTGVGAGAIASLAASAVFQDWFAGGWMEWGAGSSIQRRSIIGSTVPVAGAITLTLHRYLASVPAVGQTITLYPGCDGQYVTCKAYNSGTNPKGKFNNKPNFGGDPYTPIANPSTDGLADLNQQGGKK